MVCWDQRIERIERTREVSESDIEAANAWSSCDVGEQLAKLGMSVHSVEKHFGEDAADRLDTLGVAFFRAIANRVDPDVDLDGWLNEKPRFERFDDQLAEIKRIHAEIKAVIVGATSHA